MRGIRGAADGGHLDRGLAHEDGEVLALLGQHDRHDVAGAARACGATGTVQVCLVLGGRIDVDDQLHVVDVDAARCDVGGHQHACLTGGERRQVAVTGRLRQVAVQVDRGDSRLGELTGQLAGLVLGAHEQDPASGSGGQPLDQLALGFDAVHVEHVVRHGRDGRVRLVDRVQNLVLQEPLHQLVDAVVQGGGEQQPLSLLGGRGEDAGDDGQEAEVGHVVGLVEHGDLDGVEAHELLLHQVFEPSGARDDDVDAGLEGAHLTVLGDTTEDRGDPQVVGGCEGLEGGGDLRGELTGGGQDQADRATRAALSARQFAREAGHHRNGEGERLTAARLSPAEHVAARQRVGEGVDLDGERGGDPLVGECFHQGVTDTERGERRVGSMCVRQVVRPFGHRVVPGGPIRKVSVGARAQVGGVAGRQASSP
ncbi:Uncharacterised protein [Rhodococcus wratislaviensis]|uniref:Uncharacterized protein n=1 Tax=Rhodococcus wratislaviensis TaxID=44752 RepID=A0AB38FAQ6_RHOWR|nr:Uncharacterised protein [Rhodococcus wratislaviensis]